MNPTPRDPIDHLTAIERTLSEQSETLDKLVKTVGRNRRRRLFASVCKTGIVAAGVLLLGKLVCDAEKATPIETEAEIDVSFDESSDESQE